jgi:hypothetical protein
MRSKRKPCDTARWRHSLGPAAVAMILLSLVGPPVTAQEYVEEQHGEATAGEHEEHEFHRHHVSVFLGATTADIPVGGEHGNAGTESEGGDGSEETTTETESTIGLDYQYRFSRAWGLAFAFEYVGGDARNWMAGLAPALHPVAGLEIYAGPGFERNDGENEFVFRVGMGYEFELGRWGLTPAFNVDFVDGEQTYVYGFYVGKGF